MPTPAISIVLCTYDRPASLARCLTSLLAQQIAHPFEILVVDNHPQSGLTPRHPGVRWLEEPTPGLSHARNRGILAAQGAIIVTTDDDVVAPPDWLERLTRPLFDSSVAAVTGNCLAARLETEAEALFEAYGGLRHGDTPADFDRAWLDTWRLTFPQLWRIGTTANAAFRASLFRDPSIGLYDPRLGAGSPTGAWEDLYAFYRMLRAGHRIAYRPEACLRHFHRDTLDGLSRQLCGYRRGETAFLVLVLLRHGDLRALGQLCLWIPWWRAILLAQEAGRRLRGRRQFPFRLLAAETLAYLQGPWSLWRAHRLSQARARTSPSAHT